MAQQQQQEEEEEDALLPQQGEGDEDEEGFEVAAAASRVRGLMQHGCKHYGGAAGWSRPAAGRCFGAGTATMRSRRPTSGCVRSARKVCLADVALVSSSDSMHRLLL